MGWVERRALDAPQLGQDEAQETGRCTGDPSQRIPAMRNCKPPPMIRPHTQDDESREKIHAVSPELKFADEEAPAIG